MRALVQGGERSSAKAHPHRPPALAPLPLAVLLGALQRLAGAPSGELTAHALCGAAALLRGAE